MECVCFCFFFNFCVFCVFFKCIRKEGWGGSGKRQERTRKQSLLFSFLDHVLGDILAQPNPRTIVARLLIIIQASNCVVFQPPLPLIISLSFGQEREQQKRFLKDNLH